MNVIYLRRLLQSINQAFPSGITGVRKNNCHTFLRIIFPKNPVDKYTGNGNQDQLCYEESNSISLHLSLSPFHNFVFQAVPDSPLYME